MYNIQEKPQYNFLANMSLTLMKNKMPIGSLIIFGDDPEVLREVQTNF